MGLLYDGEDFYFTEYCAMRFGWDGCFSEIVMRDDGKPFVGAYFEDVMEGKNPLLNEFGASVRLFNLNGTGEETGAAQDDIPVKWGEEVEDNLFLYLLKQKDGECVSVGGYDLLGSATGASDVLGTAVGRAYGVIEGVNFENLYYRAQFDYLSMDYRSSILSRYAAMKPFIEENDKDEDQD
jgi:hypothetical protein